jgi:transcriptional regulator with GAF, ATPase, and Fis domain
MSTAIFRGGAVRESALAVGKAQSPPDAAAPGLIGESAAIRRVLDQGIRSVLESAGWRVRGPGGAAERLGLRPTTLEARMVKLGLNRPQRA